MSSRPNPFREVERLFETMGRQFDDAAHMFEGEGPLGRFAELDEMAIDLVERDDEFVVTVDLPGFERDDIEVTVTDHTLRIEAEHEAETEEEDDSYLRRERRHQSASRSVRLPGEVDRDAVAGTMKNGVLTVTLPKAEAEDAHTIDIE
ncbi:Hsp20/alpha crystallin family protein [Haloglomus salinum]|jgi:HSP20 family protein|uniref:Hsp20/alpha crystallin family protein n=1 Tax=Haloglomus salinum TaxID=2962673 RepID=UPI0020CA0701|nr:Hsp20/alpha crystallin family protein [Haloglomus salinum]